MLPLVVLRVAPLRILLNNKLLHSCRRTMATVATTGTGVSFPLRLPLVDDFHLHLRDGEGMASLLARTSMRPGRIQLLSHRSWYSPTLHFCRDAIGCIPGHCDA
jgi:hypothetical protein